MPVWALALSIISGTASMFFVLFCCGTVLAKTGENKWKIFIPFYGMYLFYKRTTDMGLLFWILLAASVLAAMANLLSIILCLFVITNILVFHFLFCINLADAFGHNAGFAVGLFFLFPVFIAILAFGASKYLNPNVAASVYAN